MALANGGPSDAFITVGWLGSLEASAASGQAEQRLGGLGVHERLALYGFQRA
jgi:hypothetical protein